ncbi:hypothetical protein BAE44_0009523 [Dichanthelium oligosanthes]|uniref:Phytosulfokine n=1 Tax=Dichanthelium oligosanthes TaxID=888268 RepID=A0A1E5VWH5_9POAL|nr:hypothetical protein BAE44_0009523 [Dichanthelium oligosanthes]
MKRCSSISSPLGALALLLLLVCFFHCAAAAPLLPATVPPLVHQDNGVKSALDGLGAAVSGDELSVSEMMGAEEEEPACEANDECMQRRLLRDAHLDYIYTQHKGKPSEQSTTLHEAANASVVQLLKAPAEMRRCSVISSPLAALAALLLLVCFSHCAAAARPLAAAAVPLLVHQENGVKLAADELVLQKGAAGNGDELVSVAEVMGAEEEAEEPACEEGTKDECLQRRLLRDAHLDYIYTQHKGKP